MAKRLLVVALVLLTTLPVGACTPDQKPSPSDAPAAVTSTVQFRFDIVNLRTDHQFAGQRNTLRLSYGYQADLRGGKFDPTGHRVNPTSFPYFQNIRRDVLAYVRTYPDRTNFYEVFAADIAQHVMTLYPQLAWLTLTVEVPAYGQERYARTAVIHSSRNRSG